jgi:ATP-dependent RNA helicase DHX37/DHR1
LTAGFLDQVAVRRDVVDKKHSTGIQYTSSKGVAYRALGISDDVFIHPSSLLFNAAPPDYLVFQDIVQTSRIYLKGEVVTCCILSARKVNRNLGLTIINPAWLSVLGKDVLCKFSKPIKNNAGEFMMIPRFGPDAWELPAIKAGADIKI